MVVAFHVPHNEGVVYGIFTKANQDTALLLVDLYEVDGRIRTFDNFQDAVVWLSEYGLNNVEADRVYDVQAEYMREDSLCAMHWSTRLLMTMKSVLTRCARKSSSA
jgi:hypothetical protein